jgi:hypothetical protein
MKHQRLIWISRRRAGQVVTMIVGPPLHLVIVLSQLCSRQRQLVVQVQSKAVTRQASIKTMTVPLLVTVLLACSHQRVGTVTVQNRAGTLQALVEISTVPRLLMNVLVMVNGMRARQMCSPQQIRQHVTAMPSKAAPVRRLHMKTMPLKAAAVRVASQLRNRRTGEVATRNDTQKAKTLIVMKTMVSVLKLKN